MRPNLTQAQVNHLRRLLGWVRCEVGQTPDEIVETMRGPNMPEPSPEGKARLLECHAKAAAVPKYVRAAVKALEKLLVKQEGVVVDVQNDWRSPAACPCPRCTARALPEHRRGTCGPELIGNDDGWSDTAPTEPGRYMFRSMENNYQAEEVPLTLEDTPRGPMLTANCPHLLQVPMPYYHDCLTDSSWKKLENEQ